MNKKPEKVNTTTTTTTTTLASIPPSLSISLSLLHFFINNLWERESHQEATSNRERYLAELLAEKHKLGPFMQILPLCNRLLNQEIRRVGYNPSIVDHERFDHDNPFRSLGHPNGRPIDLEGLSAMQTEENGHLQRMASFQTPSMSWPGVPGIPTTPVVKRVVRLDVPVDKYPNYNFVGRILGPRGNSLKRVEALTECRVFIRGQGSVKDTIKEEKLKDKPGYEHLNEPLHVLVEAEFPEDVINSRLDHAVAILENLLKPVDESLDHYKKQQLRELAMLNGTLREESPSMSPTEIDNAVLINFSHFVRQNLGGLLVIAVFWIVTLQESASLVVVAFI
ncbi:hypothetical protein Q3G72_029657 [Acer saccharum]|nr:hypothetical protein Q3G72_029657 [Acer saccharum]